MLTKFPAVLLASALLVTAQAVALADDASHEKAAENLLVAMKVEKTMKESIDQVLDLQIKQNPMLANIRPVMREFLGKHISWDALKKDMVKLYVAEFNETELNELTAFYKSAAGQKMAEKQAKLSAKMMELGMKRVSDNQNELRQMIEESLKKDKQ